MSGIQLSSDLVADVRDVLIKHDPEAENDMFFMQYLSAITGFVLAHQASSGLDKRSFLNDLHVFSGQVVDQMENDIGNQDLRQQPQQEEAFGVWKPE